MDNNKNNSYDNDEEIELDVDYYRSYSIADQYGHITEIGVYSYNFNDVERVTPGESLKAFDFATGQSPREVHIRLNSNHPMYKRFKSDENFRDLITKILSGLAIGFSKNMWHLETLNKDQYQGFIDGVDDMLKQAGVYLATNNL